MAGAGRLPRRTRLTCGDTKEIRWRTQAAGPGRTPSVLAIDAGQTGMKVRVTRDTHTDDLVFDGIHTHRPLLPQPRRRRPRRHRPCGTHAEILTAGISGLTDRDADAGALLELLRDTGIRGAVLAHDSTTSFLGALGDARGAVVASGTGVVTFAVGRDAIARVDGSGHIMGDAGSGYWIGARRSTR